MTTNGEKWDSIWTITTIDLHTRLSSITILQFVKCACNKSGDDGDGDDDDSNGGDNFSMVNVISYIYETGQNYGKNVNSKTATLLLVDEPKWNEIDEIWDVVQKR